MNNTSLAQPALWQGLTLRDLITAAMVSHPHEKLFTHIGLDSAIQSFTARSLDHIATRIARRFATAGAQHGDAILIAMPNGVPAFLAILGSLGAGLKPCLVPPTLSAHAIGLLLERLKPRALVSMTAPQFDPLSVFIHEARRLTMPLYVWNFGPSDHDLAAPLYDLLDGQAPNRMAPLHPPHRGDGNILTLLDRGAGPEIVTHQQDHLLALAVLAQMTMPDPHPPRMISAVSIATQAGLVLGPLRALLRAAPLTLIEEPSSVAFHAAAQGAPAEWILPQTLATRWSATTQPLSGATLTTLYRAGLNSHQPFDARGFVAFGEALVLPIIRHGQSLGQGPIMAHMQSGPFHFATLNTQDDGTLQLTSAYAGRCKDGSLASPHYRPTRAPEGFYTRFTTIKGGQFYGR